MSEPRPMATDPAAPIFRKSSSVTVRALRPLLMQLSSRRRRQLRLTVVLMVLGGMAEMAGLAAVIIFLGLIAGPQADSSSRIVDLLASLGWFRGEHRLVIAIGALIGTGLVAMAIRLILAWVSAKLVLRVGHDIGVEIYSRLLRQPYSLHVQRNTSEVISGIEKIQFVLFAVLLPLMQAMVSAIVAIFIIIALLAINFTAAILAAISIAIPYLIVSVASRRVLRGNSAILSTTQTQRVKQVQEALGGIRDILIDQSQDVFEEGFRKIDDAYRRAQTINAFVAAAPRYVVEFAGIMLIALLAWLTSLQPGGVMGALPILGAMALGAQRLVPLVQQVYAGWSYLVGSDTVVADVVQLLHAPVVGWQPRDRSAKSVSFDRTIEFANVSFTYPGSDRPAIDGLDLTIRRDEKVGFIGETGSGKSTILDLLMGLLEPTSGTISIDGVPLTRATVANWHGQLAHVPQAIYLADRSIAANIAFGEQDADIDQQRVEMAARRAQVHSFIAALPEGYQTRAGELGVRMSGGQKQRIGIARALYKHAGILVLDEATSALDESTEAAVMASLNDGSGDKTVLIIAHRLSTLRNCDRILRFQDGRLIADGSYAEIIGDPAGGSPAPHGDMRTGPLNG